MNLQNTFASFLMPDLDKESDALNKAILEFAEAWVEAKKELEGVPAKWDGQAVSSYGALRLMYIEGANILLRRRFPPGVTVAIFEVNAYLFYNLSRKVQLAILDKYSEW